MRPLSAVSLMTLMAASAASMSAARRWPAAGAFALTENNLYTTDAFVDYLSHLTPDGFLAFTRWGLDPPRESLRLISLGMAALGTLAIRFTPARCRRRSSWYC